MTGKCQWHKCENTLPAGRRKFCSTKCGDLDYQKRFRERNREKLRKKAALYRSKPGARDKNLAYLARWRAENPGAYQQWAAGNAERLRQKDAAWRAANPDKVAEYQKTRRTRRMGASGDGLTADDWAEIQRWSDHRCVYCGVGGPLSQDHVIPLSRGGAHDVTNIVPACRSCNSSKCDRGVSEWAPEWVAPWWIEQKPDTLAV